MLAAALISPLSIAPMIDWTYSHFRVFMRLLAPQALLYTEMQTVGAVLHQPTRALHYHAAEKPLALQLGGSDKDALVKCAIMAEQAGFVEVNLNLGCPSERVKAGNFGACLMAEPQLVGECIAAIKRAVNITVSAKVRIGIDHLDSYNFFKDFALHITDKGCDKVIVHARKAWLSGLSPKQNRTIPPLHYDYVYNLKQELAHIPIIINGNIQSIDDMHLHLKKVDGVMLGRLAYQNPYAIAKMHHSLFHTTPILPRHVILELYIRYLMSLKTIDMPITLLLKPILNLAHSLPGAKYWKACLLTESRSKDLSTLLNVVSIMEEMAYL